MSVTFYHNPGSFLFDITSREAINISTTFRVLFLSRSPPAQNTSLNADFWTPSIKIDAISPRILFHTLDRSLCLFQLNSTSVQMHNARHDVEMLTHYLSSGYRHLVRDKSNDTMQKQTHGERPQTCHHSGSWRSSYQDQSDQRKSPS